MIEADLAPCGNTKGLVYQLAPAQTSFSF